MGHSLVTIQVIVMWGSEGLANHTKRGTTGCAGMCSVGEVIQVYCDNEVAVRVLNSGYSLDREIMHLLRGLFFIKAHFQMEVNVTHLAGSKNTQADAVSCNLLSFFSLTYLQPIKSQQVSTTN